MRQLVSGAPLVRQARPLLTQVTGITRATQTWRRLARRASVTVCGRTAPRASGGQVITLPTATRPPHRGETAPSRKHVGEASPWLSSNGRALYDTQYTLMAAA